MNLLTKSVLIAATCVLPFTLIFMGVDALQDEFQREAVEKRLRSWGVAGKYFAAEVQMQRERGALPGNSYASDDIIRVFSGDNKSGMNSLSILTPTLCRFKDGRLYDEWDSEIIISICGDRLLLLSAGPDKFFNGANLSSEDDLLVVVPLSEEDPKDRPARSEVKP